MLQELTIANFVLIEREQLYFKEGLNIITGETGAGKSIIFSAIRCLLGQKSTKELVRKSADNARLEGVFFHNSEKLRILLEDNGFIDEDGQLIITREFNEKRSIIKINGRTCLNSFIKQIGVYLIDFHGQRDNSILLDNKSHLSILNTFGGKIFINELSTIKTLVTEYTKNLDEIIFLQNGSNNVERELDLLSYQIKEIEEAGLKENEDVEIEERLSFLRNGELIHSNLSEVQSVLQDTDGIGDLSDKLIQQLSSVETFDEHLKELYDLAQDLVSTSEELQTSTRRYLDSFDRDEEELFYLEERNNTINSLKMKYGQSVELILNFYDGLVEEYDRMRNSSQRLVELQEIQLSIETEYAISAEALSQKRKVTAQTLQNKINDELQHLNLKGAELIFEFTENNRLSYDGKDKVEILVITNPGETFKSIKKIASGGEISRFMLAIKSITENESTGKTLIYDEIDTGISGETAEVVGERLFNLAKDNQIISVTHLPQIAVFADHHLIIEKVTGKTHALTKILHGEGSHIKRELGRLVAGKTISINTLKHVEEMMNNAFKKKL